MQCSARNGGLVSAIQVEDGEEMMLITNRGTLVRTRVDEISTTSRNTQGVTLIRLTDEEKLSGTVRVQDIGEDPDAELDEDALLEGDALSTEDAVEQSETDQPEADQESPAED